MQVNITSPHNNDTVSSTFIATILLGKGGVPPVTSATMTGPVQVQGAITPPPHGSQTWSAHFVGVPAGENNYTLTATDNAGNTGVVTPLSVTP